MAATSGGRDEAGRGEVETLGRGRELKSREERNSSQSVRFHEATDLTRADVETLQETIRRQVLRWFRRQGLLEEHTVREMLSWDHAGGFGVRRDHVGQSASETTDRAKTIVDCLDRPELSGGVVEVAKALQEGDGEFDWGRTTEYLSRFGSGAVVKRLGFLAEALELEHPTGADILAECRELLTAGISKLDPSSPREPHRIATRWRVAVNLPEQTLVAPG